MKKIEHRGFLVQQVKGMPTLFEIKFNGSGKLAEALQGTYTTASLAINRIDTYVEGGLGKKAVKNEANSQG